MPKVKFLRFIHLYRAFAILMIVAGHVFASLEWSLGREAEIDKVDIVFFDNVSVIFVFISGFLFQHLLQKFKYRSYLKTKFKYVILPYLVISIPVIIVRILLDRPTSFLLDTHPDFVSYHPLFQAGFYLLTGAHLRPLWFIPMIAIFYLTSPLFKLADDHPKCYPFLVVGAIALSIVVPRSSPTDVVSNYLHFLSPYIAGMFISRYKTIVTALFDRFSPLGVLILYFFVAGCLEYPSTHLSFLTKLYSSVFFLYVFWKIQPFFKRRMAKIADYSFGIFFLHDYFDLLYKIVLEKITGDPFIKGNYILFMIIFVAIVALCVVHIKFIKSLFGRYSRMIIGS